MPRKRTAAAAAATAAPSTDDKQVSWTREKEEKMKKKKKESPYLSFVYGRENASLRNWVEPPHGRLDSVSRARSLVSLSISEEH
jgi:hypothetical protein